MSDRGYGCLFWFATIVVIGLLVVTGVGITAAIHWGNRCEQAGGHTVPTVGGRGGSVCVSPDGRVIEP